MLAKIYQPAQSAMTSGAKNSNSWCLEFASKEARQTDHLMGWCGSGDTQTQIQLSFETKEEAIAYARANGIPYQIFEPKRRKPNIRPGGYGENFSTNRKDSWTH